MRERGEPGEPAVIAAPWWRPLRIGEFRLIPAIERYPSIVRFAQTMAGKAVVLGVYGLLLFLNGDYTKWFAPLALAAPTFAPSHRRKFVVLATLGILLVRPYRSSLDSIARSSGFGSMTMLHGALALGALAACVAYARLTFARPGSVLATSPVASAICLFLALVLGASFVSIKSGPAAVFFWGLVVALGHFVWFLCYTVKNRSPRSLGALLFEVGHYNPFWYPNAGSGGVPVPKGSSFLDRIEAKTPEELAVSQLKGLKLTAWAVILALLGDVLSGFAYGETSPLARLLGVRSLDIPLFEDALAASATGHPLPFYMGWIALGTHFFLQKLLTLAIGLHFAIGMARMAGFRAPRGVYRPFRARSFADFWNRVHYYFKELMVELFFYPVYFRWFKRRPRLRMVTAIFAAAFVGNWLYHFLRDIEWIALHGLAATLIKWKTYALYTLLLAVGISLSTLRGVRPAAEQDSGAARAAGSFAVILSYCLLGILDDNGGASITDCGRFLLDLFPRIGPLPHPFY